MKNIWRWVKYAWKVDRALSLLILFSCGCLLASVIGLSFDPRLIQGEHAWIKPCKFSMSFMIYGATLIWLSTFLSGGRRRYQSISVAASAGGIVELACIILQVLRGTTSHFNTQTPFDHAVFLILTIAIVPVSLAAVVMYVRLLTEPRLPPVLGSSLKWGLFLTIVGLIPGVLMILPDPLQNRLVSFRPFDGHTVGLSHNDPGLPFLGWSTTAGDLRVAHFVGIHALQVLPMVGLAITQGLRGLSVRDQLSLVWNAGVSYLGLISILTWQALCAEPMSAPSHRTVLALWILATLSLLWFSTIVGRQVFSKVKSTNPHPHKFNIRVLNFLGSWYVSKCGPY